MILSLLSVFRISIQYFDNHFVQEPISLVLFLILYTFEYINTIPSDLSRINESNILFIFVE